MLSPKLQTCVQAVSLAPDLSTSKLLLLNQESRLLQTATRACTCLCSGQTDAVGLSVVSCALCGGGASHWPLQPLQSLAIPPTSHQTTRPTWAALKAPTHSLLSHQNPYDPPTHPLPDQQACPHLFPQGIHQRGNTPLHPLHPQGR
jgi:hypothetical protein